MIADKLRKATFKYIESEVYHLQETLRMIDLIRYEILHGTSKEDSNPEAGKNSVRDITDETERKATALFEEKRLRKLEKNSNAILKIYDDLIDERKELVKLYYWKRPGELTWEGIAKELHISRRTAIRWRKAFIYKVAEELGER